MDRQQLIEREASLGRIAGIVGVAGVLMLLIPPVLGLGGDFARSAVSEYALRMEAFEAARDEILLSQILQAVGVIMMGAPLVFLFQAAAARDETMLKPLLGLAIIGPLFVGISLILNFVAYDGVATEFLDNATAGADADEEAENLLVDQSAYDVFGILQLSGLFALIIALVYTSLKAMRVGLLTRFLGTLGMALGVANILPQLSLIAFGIWALVMSPFIAAWWRGPRPPAWEAGEAIPWPAPGESPAKEPEQLADPDEFEDADGDGVADGPSERPARRDNRKKRKRKQR